VKTQTVLVAKDVRLPEDEHDWQLYDAPGAASAARALTQALLEALQYLPADLPMAWKHFQLTQDQHGAVGACDTEPRDVALAAFDQVFGKALVRRTIG
jgi:hypothetical protein